MLHLLDRSRIEVFPFHVWRDCLSSEADNDKKEQWEKRWSTDSAWEVFAAMHTDDCCTEEGKTIQKTSTECSTHFKTRISWKMHRDARISLQGILQAPQPCLNHSVRNVVLVKVEQTIQKRFRILQDLLGGTRRTDWILSYQGKTRNELVDWHLLTRLPVVVNLFARRVGIILLDLSMVYLQSNNLDSAKSKRWMTFIYK